MTTVLFPAMDPSLLSIPTVDISPAYFSYSSNFTFSVTILVLLTYGGELPPDLLKSGGAIELAVSHVRNDILPGVLVDYQFLSRPGFTQCFEEENHGAYLMTKFAFHELKIQRRPRVGLLVGPGCIKTLESVGQVSADMKLPIVTSQGFSSPFDNKDIYKTTTRTGVTVRTMSHFIMQFLDAHNWTNVAVIYDDLYSWSSAVGSMLFRAFYFRKNVPMQPMNLPYRNLTDFSTLLYSASNNSRVIFILGKASSVREIMLQAFYLGMTKGDYVFLTCEWYKEKYWGTITWQMYDQRDQDANKAYRSLFIIREAVLRDKEFAKVEEFVNFEQQAKSLAWRRFGYGFAEGEDLSPAVTELYDGIILWATALNETLEAHEDPWDGLRLTRKIWNRQFRGINGTIRIDANGDRDCSYLMLDLNPETGIFTNVFYYKGNGSQIESLHPIDWNTVNNQPPPNEPECGYLNNKPICLLRNDKSKIIIAAIGGVAGALLLLALLGFQVIQKVKTRQALQNTWWRVAFEEIKFQTQTPSCSIHSTIGIENMDGGHKLDVASCHERQVVVQNLDQKIELTKEMLVYLSKIHGVNHENLTHIIGLCPEPSHEAILTEFCSKGSLVDLLANDTIELDWGFKSSLITDLVAVGSHREFLRSGMPVSGSQKGDLYSMAIVLSEIVTRREPFSMEKLETERSPAEIIFLIKNGTEPPLRPEISVDECHNNVIKTIALCWSENPKDRPTIREAQSLLKENGVAKGSVMDNIIRRMEQYASNLESTVNERTKAFLEEKRKVEALLYEILPRAVADALKMGKQIPPEVFEVVTIYYSDIVGFTTISFKSTAFQVVDLLNDLYTLFDGNISEFDAYKVETIGDAYVVGSGVPIRNGNLHASEIAKMSLKFRDTVGLMRIRHLPDESLQLRIGNHSGYVAAGVVGVKMPRYCLFGETVVIANKMESSGQAMKIQVSETTKAILDEFGIFDLEFRHVFQYGSKKINAYWLNGLKDPMK